MFLMLPIFRMFDGLSLRQCRPVFDKNSIVDQGLSVHGLSLFVDNIAVRNATI